jgi:hypothetical protein
VSHPAVFSRLKWVSFTHSCVYTALLVCAFVAGKPQPATLVLGWTHGLLWIGMSLACIACARLRIVPLRLAVAVAVLGGIGPFFGSAEFVREQRRRDARDSSTAIGDRPRSPYAPPPQSGEALPEKALGNG